jgi:hypothetical protein
MPFAIAIICSTLALLLFFELRKAIRFGKHGILVNALVVSLDCQMADGSGGAPTPSLEIELPNGEKEIRRMGFGSERFAKSVGQIIQVRYLQGTKYVLPNKTMCLFVRPFIIACFFLRHLLRSCFRRPNYETVEPVLPPIPSRFGS